jgi:hypothetical protein
MQCFLVIGLAPILLLAMKVAIRNVEQELPRKPFRHDDTDCAIRGESKVYSPFILFCIAVPPG